MTRSNLRMVKALVVARWRELALIPTRVVLSMLAMTMLAFLPPSGVLSVLMAAEAGVFAGIFATGRLPRRWLDNPETNPASLRQDLVPALPVGSFTRAVATTLVACALALPYFLVALTWGYRWNRALTSGSIALGGLALGILTNLAWTRLARGRVRLALARLADWIRVPLPARLSETGAAFSAMFPSMLIWTLLFTPLVSSLGAFLIFHELTNEHHFSPRFARVLLCFASYSIVLSPLTNRFKAIAALPTTRRAVALAELRLALVALVLSGLFAVALTHGVAGDVRLTRGVARLFVALGGVATVSRVVFVRLACSRSSNVAAFLVAAPTVVAFSVVVVASMYVRARALDTISVVAFLIAVLLAYTAPNTPLSTSPFRTDRFANLRRSPATPRGK